MPLFKLTLKFNKFVVREKVIEAKNEVELEKAIEKIPFWNKNKERIKKELKI